MALHKPQSRRDNLPRHPPSPRPILHSQHPTNRPRPKNDSTPPPHAHHPKSISFPAAPAIAANRVPLGAPLPPRRLPQRWSPHKPRLHRHSHHPPQRQRTPTLPVWPPPPTQHQIHRRSNPFHPPHKHPTHTPLRHIPPLQRPNEPQAHQQARQQ